MGQLESGSRDDLYQYVVEPGLSRYTSVTFEDVCRQFLRRRSNQKRLPFPASKIERWWGKKTVRNEKSGRLETFAVEIDILAEDFRNEYCLVGECKYTGEQVGAGVLSNLRSKYPQGSDHLKILYALFAKSGFKESPELASDDVLLFDIEEIAED